MCKSLPDREVSPPEAHFRELDCQLLGFHRREAKPAWWALFNRQDMTEEELVEDIECLGGLVWDGKIKVSGNREVPERLLIGPNGPINSDVHREATLRFADWLLAEDNRFAALRALLTHPQSSPPWLAGDGQITFPPPHPGESSKPSPPPLAGEG